MRKIILSVWVIMMGHLAWAQSDAQISNIQVLKLGSWSPEWDHDGIDASIHTHRLPHANPQKEALKAYKDSIAKIKIEQADKLEHSLQTNASDKTTVDLPSVTQGFETATTQGTPSDNTIAVNTKGQVLVSVNSLVRVYSTTGSSLSVSTSLHNFFSNPSNGGLLTNNVCDPKVLFDPEMKRFVVMAQTCSGSSSSSQILLAFSKTEDATGGWNFYTFTGNPSSVSGNVWFDYPKVGLNSHDLFVTGNLFTNNNYYKESVIYMIDKQIGMSGSNYNNGDVILYNSISGSPFTLVPANQVFPNTMGNKMYFVCTWNSSVNSNRLLFYELDGPVQNAPNLQRHTLYVTTYSAPIDAIQQGSNTRLDVSDFRGMDAICIDGMVHFVTHIGGNNGYNKIMYNRIFKNSSGAWGIDEYEISANNVDLAYPSIAGIGHTVTDQSVLILMDLASPSHYPSVGAVQFNDAALYSSIGVVKAGTGPVSIQPSSGVTRWGDYTGLCRDHSVSTPTVWGYGMFGKSNITSRWSNWVSNFISQEPQGIKEVSPEQQSLRVFPNPVIDVFNLTFETENTGQFEAKLYDIKGSLVRDLYAQTLQAGKHTFAFNKGTLPTGAYVIKLMIDGVDIASESVMVK